jgi:ferric-dicitrate binding protein FerR (iron transport regulator)
MSAADCERWMQLADQAAVGEQLTDRDKAWLSQHADACEQCGAEKQFYASLGDALGHPEMLVVPSATKPPTVPRALSRRPVLVGLAMAASVAIIVGGYAYARRHRPMSSTPPAPPALSTPPPMARVVLASGVAQLGSQTAQAGQQIAQGERLSTESGQACAGIGDTIDVCLDGASVARITLSEPDRILVYLEQGTLMARLDHQPAGRTFIVRTAGAEVQAVGTRFSVHVAPDGHTRVRLHEGRLAVRAANRVATDLAAPVQASIAQDIRVAPISPDAATEDRPLAKLAEAARLASGTALMLTSAPAGADVFLDNVAMGKTPLSTFLRASAHVRLSLPGYQPASDWVVCDRCEQGAQPGIARAFTLTPQPVSPPEPADKPSHPRGIAPRLSPDQLLAKAQSLRAQERYQACAQLYRRLMAEYPGSEAAKVSMVSLGELELVHTKDPAAALRAFNAYLRLGGPLEREARFGKIRALRALDRRDEADAETAGFLRDYPTSTQAAILRQRGHGD